MNLYVIDDAARTPIANAEVRVGAISGTTDADGLFVADGVTGPQDVVAKAPGHRAELWLGANGANMTMNLVADNVATPASANLSGSITGFTGLTVAAGHAKLALVTYSNTDDLGDPANEIAQTTENQNLCFGVQAADPCNFTVTTRTGKVALVAAIFDRDLKGTADPADDTSVLLAWAVRQGLDVTGGANQTGVDLTIVSASNTQSVSAELGSPPSSLTTVGAIVGIELGDEGIAQLPAFLTPSAPSLMVPKLAGLTGATGYRLTAIANDGSTTNGAQSVVLRRGLSGPTLAAGDWLAPPTAVALTRTGGSWTNAANATAHGVELAQGGTRLLNVTVLDGRTTVTMPDLVTLPSGSLTATVNAIGADNFDVTNFSLDADRDKLNRVGGQSTTIN
ncbi:MAG TPA: hypothetical protein VFQ53_02825 [Kofleriaceae bacterium]|nr:hypothetical protein [Kofleriaceae bacterium]